MEIKKIYLHWSATPYSWYSEDAYHIIIDDKGNIKNAVPLNEESTHTYKRNSNSIGIACACMGGVDYWEDYPPTEAQINAMCKETARIAKSLGWTVEDITVKKVLTHGEAASLRDFSRDLVEELGNSEEDYDAEVLGLPHSNYGAYSWYDGWHGGTGERWDWNQLKSSDKQGVGGDILRGKIKAYMEQSINHPTIQPDSQREKIKASIAFFCKQYGLDEQFILAQFITESNLNPDAVSSSKALGVAQIKLTTAQELAKRQGIKIPKSDRDLLGVSNADYNIQLGCALMKELIQKQNNQYYAAFQLYLSGASSFEKGVLNPDAVNYVNKISKKYNELKSYY